MFDYVNYARELRHELHRVPEIGFDLEKTLGIVRRELDAMGVSYTEKFGRSSVVATINEGKPYTIGLRADMDALPIAERSRNPYKSEHEGIMHACGHDVHTSQMLAVTRKLNDMRDQLRCRVKILFTPAEEYSTPGSMLMAEDGVMDDIDVIVAAHVDPNIPVGQVVIQPGGQGSNSMGINVEFFGKSAHAQVPQKGIDAIRMAVSAYNALELMVAKEVSPLEPVIYNVGAFNAGNTNNIVCDYAKLMISSRTWSDELSEFLERRTGEICEASAAMMGGTVKVTRTKLLPFVPNDPVVTERMRLAAEKVVGSENIQQRPRGLGGEDFSFLARKKPGMLFRLGTRNEENPETQNALHNACFDVDEGCYAVGIPIFVNFVLDNQDGIQF